MIDLENTDEKKIESAAYVRFLSAFKHSASFLALLKSDDWGAIETIVDMQRDMDDNARRYGSDVYVTHLLFWALHYDPDIRIEHFDGLDGLRQHFGDEVANALLVLTHKEAEHDMSESVGADGYTQLDRICSNRLATVHEIARLRHDPSKTDGFVMDRLLETAKDNAWISDTL